MFLSYHFRNYLQMSLRSEEDWRNFLLGLPFEKIVSVSVEIIRQFKVIWEENLLLKQEKPDVRHIGCQQEFPDLTTAANSSKAETNNYDQNQFGNGLAIPNSLGNEGNLQISNLGWSQIPMLENVTYPYFDLPLLANFENTDGNSNELMDTENPTILLDADTRQQMVAGFHPYQGSSDKDRENHPEEEIQYTVIVEGVSQELSETATVKGTLFQGEGGNQHMFQQLSAIENQQLDRDSSFDKK